MVSSLVEMVNGCHLVFRRRPGFPIHAGCSFARVFCHSPDGKGFATKRAGEQAGPRLHLVPFARLSCLRETDLQPTNSPFSPTPVNLVPVEWPAGGRTNRGVSAHTPQSFPLSSAFPP
jgi:hypothetical protein